MLIQYTNLHCTFPDKSPRRKIEFADKVRSIICQNQRELSTIRKSLSYRDFRVFRGSSIEKPRNRRKKRKDFRTSQQER
jgi:hypothetical protein